MLHLQGLPHRDDQPLRERGTREAWSRARLGHGRGVRSRRAKIRRPERRSPLQVHRGAFQIHCQSQQEVDYYWSKLTQGGKEVQCGWLKDKFGLSWQVVPDRPHRHADGFRLRQSGAGDQSLSPDEEVRHRSPEAGVRRKAIRSGDCDPKYQGGSVP